MDFFVGTFNHPSIYHFQFTPPTPTNPTPSLQLLQDHPAIAGHSWLTLSPSHTHLYCTAWTTQPSIAAYSIQPPNHTLQFLNSQRVNSLSGYVCTNTTHIFSAGGPTGEVFRLLPSGAIGELVQTLDFATHQGANHSAERGVVPHGDFGGLRHGAHSVDLSPDGNTLYVADIGRNCIWTYRVRRGGDDDDDGPPLELTAKILAPRGRDGPRHAWPHPGGKVLYVLQEHSSMVDVFRVGEDGVGLAHVQGGSILPAGRDCGEFWADEVRCSTTPPSSDESPRFLYGSARGLEKGTKGFVAAWRLTPDGLLESEVPLDVWETPTSGGLANAIEPAPWREEFGGVEFLAMCDSEEGVVSILQFDGVRLGEVARWQVGRNAEGKVIGVATPVWL